MTDDALDVLRELAAWGDDDIPYDTTQAEQALFAIVDRARALLAAQEPQAAPREPDTTGWIEALRDRHPISQEQRELIATYIEQLEGAAPSPAQQTMAAHDSSITPLVTAGGAPEFTIPAAQKTAWLIERGQQEGESPTLWYLAEPYPEQGRWVVDANQATRFKTMATAQRCIDDKRLVFCRATEHVWIATPAPAVEPTDRESWPPATGSAYRARMEYLMQAVAALLREYGLLRCEWSIDGVDPTGRKVKHRIHVDGYVRVWHEKRKRRRGA